MPARTGKCIGPMHIHALWLNNLHGQGLPNVFRLDVMFQTRCIHARSQLLNQTGHPKILMVIRVKSLNQTILTKREKKLPIMLFTGQLLYFSLMSIKTATVLSKFEFFLTLIGLNHKCTWFWSWPPIERGCWSVSALCQAVVILIVSH